MSKKSVNIPRLIASRYVSVGKRSQLVSFMSGIAIGGLAFSIAILITVLSVMNGFDREMRDNILGLVPHITLFSEDNLSAADWSQIRNETANVAGIAAVEPLIEIGGVIASPAGSRGVLINGIDAVNSNSSILLDQFMRAGGISDLAAERWGVVLGQTLADRLGVQLGDEVDLFSTAVSMNPLTPLPTFRAFTVTGIYRVGTQELDSELVTINLDAARALFRLRTPFNTLRLQTEELMQANNLAAELRDRLEYPLVITSWTRQFGSIYENIRFSRGIIAFMLWLLVGVAAFNLVVSLIMIVRDKNSDIAILRTLGASPGMINRIFIWQGMLIALVGIMIGVIVGVIAALQISDFAAFIERSFSIQILSAEVYPIDFLPSALELQDLVVVIIGVMLLALLATLYPARRAASIQPAEALRHD